MTTTGITGATRGLGYETARRLVEEGHTVYLGARDLARGAQAAATIGATAVQLDVTEATVDDLRLVLDTNVVGAANVLSAFTPLLDASDSPVVVNVSSAVGSLTLNAQPDARWSMLAYPTSKAALNMLTIQYARAFPRWRVNSATPGLTATDFAPSARRAGHPVEEGAKVLVRMATIGADGPTGTFVDADGVVPW
jgi:NAD(P)-dependent dehydrogenase (short-subunit alcohol dehydrogenase family)